MRAAPICYFMSQSRYDASIQGSGEIRYFETASNIVPYTDLMRIYDPAVLAELEACALSNKPVSAEIAETLKIRTDCVPVYFSPEAERNWGIYVTNIEQWEKTSNLSPIKDIPLRTSDGLNYIRRRQPWDDAPQKSETPSPPITNYPVLSLARISR